MRSSAINKMALNGTIEAFRESHIPDSLIEG